MAAANVLRAGSTTVTTAGTAVVMASTAALASWVTIQASTTNGGVIYVGADSTISGGGKGFTLANPGDSVVLWPNGGPLIDLSAIWLDSSVNGEGVTYLAIVP